MRSAILFALALTGLEAQTIEVRGFSQLAPLDGEWRYASSDDPRFAEPDFDDSSWRMFRMPGAETPEDAAWIRFRVQMPEALPAEPMALLLPPLSPSYDLFVNGRLAGSFGDPRAAMSWGSSVPAVATFPLTSGARQLSVAIRTSPYRQLTRSLPPVPALARSAWIGTAPAIAGKRREAEFETRWPSASHLAVMGATAMAGLFFVLLPLWRRQAREYLWCGLFLLASTIYRPVTAAPWMLEGVPAPLFLVMASAMAGLFIITWERLFSLLLGVRLSTWLRRCQQALLLWLLSYVTLSLADWAAPWAGSISPLLVAVYFCVVYLDLASRARAAEETPWMHTAAAMYLGGTLTYFVLRVPAIRGLLPATIDAAEFAVHMRAVGVLLFAGMMAMVLNRRSARLQGEQQRLAQEMRAGAEMQALLLPAASAEGVESVYFPAGEVGGDFYQILDRADGSRVVLVGDVSGKGLKAAMVVSTTIGMLRRENSSSPGAILAGLNDGLAGHVSGGFVTCVCARFDRDGSVTIANAGHPSPYCDGRELELAPGLPLGIVAGAAYAETMVRGASFTFISDGVVEAENTQRELFGFERTRAISAKSAQEIAEAAKAWGQNDDITVVTVRRNS